MWVKFTNSQLLWKKQKKQVIPGQVVLVTEDAKGISWPCKGKQMISCQTRFYHTGKKKKRQHFRLRIKEHLFTFQLTRVGFRVGVW